MRRSLLNHIGIYILLLISFVMFSLLSMYVGVGQLDRAQTLFVNRTLAQEQVANRLQVVETCFRQLRNSWNEEDLTAYQTSLDELEDALSQYQFYTSDAQDTQDYIRRLYSFCQYQRELIEETGELQSERYRLSSFINSAISLHQSAVREMGENDLQQARSKYQDIADLVIWMMTVTTVLSLLVVIGCAIWGVWVFSTVKRSLRTIHAHMEALADQQWEMPDLEMEYYTEFASLSHTVNLMKHKIRDSIIQIELDSQLAIQLKEERLKNERQRAELVTAQISALRAQINPHFLFNALNTIGACALVDSPENVMRLVEATGKILRYSLYVNKTVVPLDDEVDIVRQYLFLQQYRYGDELETTLDNYLEEEELRLPPMTIQPIVENCFKHGIGQTRPFAVSIRIYTRDDQLVIDVRDNGVGFDPEQALRKGGIGLTSIQKRMELQYGEGRTYVLIDGQAGSTCVTLQLPMKGDMGNEDIDR